MNDLVSKYHQRMPVIFNVEKANAFLRKDIDLESLQTLLKPFSENEMDVYPVDKHINKMTNDFPEVIKKTTNH
ncbi:MAG: SOS response-associated peptidase family protein [Tenericutes bacterium]|nr:SOS response-associated peptidase family protein [Mycoplasmatota bacterium]